MKNIMLQACMSLMVLPLVVAAQPIFKDKSVIQISDIKKVAQFNSMAPKEVTINIAAIPEHIVPVVVKIEDDRAGLFSPVAVKSIDYKTSKITFITASGGKYVAVYVKDFSPK